MIEFTRRFAGRALGVLCLTASLVIASAPVVVATHPGANGMLLVEGASGFGLVKEDGTGFVALDQAGGVWAARFSPDGATVAYAVSRNGSNTLRLRSRDGSDRSIATLPDNVTSLAWSPDGKRLALAVSAGDGTDIYRVSADGSGLTRIRRLGVWGGDEVDWHPTQNRIALIWGSDVFTMNQTGGEVAQWTNECTYPKPLVIADDDSFLCDRDGDFVTRDYSDRLSWAPDGSGLLVGMIRDCLDTCGSDVNGWFLGKLPAGQPRATPVMDWPPVKGADYYSELRASWSPDGTRFVYTTHDPATVWVRSGGTSKRVGAYKFLDWQPCPKTCARFVTSGKKPTSISAVVTTSGVCGPSGCETSGVQVTGQVTPGRPGSTTMIRLDALRSGSWTTVSTRRPTLSAKSAYVAKFGRPAGTRCRVAAIYPGDATHERSEVTKTFAC